MDRRIKSRFIKGIGANAYNQIVTIIVQLIGVPILLHAWGTELYGEWLILFAVPSYLSISDLGFSQSAANDMTAFVASGNLRKALSVFQSLGILVLCTSCMVFAVFSLALFSMPFVSWFHLTSLDSSSVRLVLLFLAAEMLVRLCDGASQAGFRSAGDYALHVNIISITRLIQFSAIWTVAITGGGLVYASIAYLMVRLVAMPITAVFLVRRHPFLRYGISEARTSELFRLWKPALANIGMPLAQALNIQGMTLVVGALLGPLSVAIFSTLRTLTRVCLQLVLSVSHSAEPELAAAYGTSDGELLKVLYVHALRTAFWLVLPAAVILGFSGKSILAIWTHGKVPMNIGLFLWLLASAVVSVFWYSALVTLRAANQHLSSAITYVIASSLALCTGILLLHLSNNIEAAGAALLLVDITMGIYGIKSLKKKLHIDGIKSLIEALTPYPLLKFLLSKAKIS